MGKMYARRLSAGGMQKYVSLMDMQRLMGIKDSANDLEWVTVSTSAIDQSSMRS